MDGRAERHRTSSGTCCSRHGLAAIWEDIAQTIDSIGGQLDAFTARNTPATSKVLDEHLPRALDVLSDLVLNPAFNPDDVRREEGGSSKRSRWSRTRRTTSL